MNLKWIDTLPERPDNSVLMAIQGIQRRLSKNIDNSESTALLGTWLEIFRIEAEKRGLSYE